MVVERETIIERPVERQTVIQQPTETVVEGGSSGAALIAGVLVAVLLALVFFWVFSGGLGNGGTADIQAPTAPATDTNG
jgi:hypothetical protein